MILRRVQIQNPENEPRAKFDPRIVDQVYRCTALFSNRDSESKLWSFLDYTHKNYTRHPKSLTSFIGIHKDGNYLFIAYVNDYGATDIDTVIIGHDGHESKLVGTSYVWKDSDALGIRAVKANFEGEVSKNSLSVTIFNFSDSATPRSKEVRFDRVSESWK